MYWRLGFTVDKHNLSPDGKWMWNGTDWIPAPPKSSASETERPLISKTNTAINLQDSVVAGDITIHQSNASEIAEAVNAGRTCMKCNSVSNNMYSCESTDCDLVFCFACMQKYIHGHRIIHHKLCQKHYYAEEEAIEADIEFEYWENEISNLIKSNHQHLLNRLNKEIHSLGNPDEAIKLSANVKKGGLSLLIFGVTILFAAMTGGFDDLDIVGLGVIGLGLLIFAGSYGITPSTENDITHTRKEIKTSHEKITLLIKNHLQYENNKRPILPTRSTPEIKDLAIINFISD